MGSVSVASDWGQCCLVAAAVRQRSAEQVPGSCAASADHSLAPERCRSAEVVPSAAGEGVHGACSWHESGGTTRFCLQSAVDG